MLLNKGLLSMVFKFIWPIKSIHLCHMALTKILLKTTKKHNLKEFNAIAIRKNKQPALILILAFFKESRLHLIIVG